VATHLLAEVEAAGPRAPPTSNRSHRTAVFAFHEGRGGAEGIEPYLALFERIIHDDYFDLGAR
jgi:hypothetical protein